MRVVLAALLGCQLVLAAGAGGTIGEESTVENKKPLLCPDKPNCVSTMDAAASHAIVPYPYYKTVKEAKEVLKQYFSGLPRSRLVKEDDEYLHFEVRSFLFQFVDDVEFVFDEATKQVHFRSAARTGTYDFGVNRRRMEKIRGVLEGRM